MNEFLQVEQLTVPGYYWWLPQCQETEPENPANWSIKAWHPQDPTRPRGGTFVGPLEPPIER